MSNFVLAIIVMLVTSVIGQKVNQKATEKLNEDQKKKLVTLFKKSSISNFIVLILILGLYFGNAKFGWIDQGSASMVFVIFILTFLIGTAYKTYKKLQENSFPQNYIQKNLLATSLRFLGLVFFFLILNFL